MKKKIERRCSFCGSTDYYAKGLCAACYRRQRINQTLEYKRPKSAGNRTDRRLATISKARPRTEQERVTLDLLKRGMTYAEIGHAINRSKQRVAQIVSRMSREENRNEH